MNNTLFATATIRHLSHEGRGVANLNGKTVFIQNALPHETVSFRYTRRHKNFDEGYAVEIVENRNPDRVEPMCPHVAICAGCSLQHLSATAQLKLKENTLKEQFKHFAHIDITHLEPALQATGYHYRHKARLSVKDVIKKNKVLIGFHEHNGRYVADIDRCPILPQAVGDKLPLLSKWVSELSVRSAIPQIEVTISADEVALIIRHVQPLPITDIEKMAAFAQNEGFSIYLQPSKHDKETRVTVATFLSSASTDENLPLIKLWPKNSPFMLHYHLANKNSTLYFSPTEFTQINPTINEQMVAQALSWLAPHKNDRVLDLFCGIGNFTIPVARRCKEIIGVEGETSMVMRATNNASHNHSDNARFLAADLTQNISHLQLLNSTFDKILIDPPRSGALQVIEQHFKAWQAKTIVYISCNPATLARDVGVLVNQLGYKLEKIGILDMFPQTNHVESMALLTRIG
ncbi:MAG: rRNA ((1939)-C(5))-methyltransferase RlmD [Gammaproteobacteria bacterium]|jgi:23S rRNA (uracil1939-C5)-methyltransferase|nr:rRNA ((1939)-C(5))-methyltransferase RlmD [Gammaproteobacteria bacterium]